MEQPNEDIFEGMKASNEQLSYSSRQIAALSYFGERFPEPEGHEPAWKLNLL